MQVRPGRVGLYGLVAVLVLWSIFPLYYALVTSFATDTQIFRPNYWPPSFNFGNYVEVFAWRDMAPALLNSAIVAGVTVALALALAIPAAFAFSRVRFRGRRLLLLTVLASTMFPQVGLLAGMYELMLRLGLYDTLGAVILSYLILTVPFTVWTLTAFMRNVPVEIEDVAIIDGASAWVIVTRIFLPLMGPAIIATGLVAAIAVWNEFLFAFTFTVETEKRTVPVAIQLIWGYKLHDTPWGVLTAACVVATAPVVALVLVLQRRMVSGLTAGLVTG